MFSRPAVIILITMFREFTRLRLRGKRSKEIVPVSLPAVVGQKPIPDPYQEAVSIVKSAGLDPDEEKATIRRLRNYWLMMRLEARGFPIFDK